MDLASIGSSVIAGAVGGSGLSLAIIGWLKDRWIEKVRAGYARELEDIKSDLVSDQKRIQARLDHSVLVSRAQLDTEFNAMKDIFRHATETWLAIGLVRPMVQHVPADQTKEQKYDALGKRLQPLIEAFNAFSQQLEILSPFYPRELYECLVRCREAASCECAQVMHGGEESLSWSGYKDAEENRTKFTKAYHEAASIIRDRLARLSVIA